MRENEFEKNVQHKMDELKLRPSDDVWLRVEQELKKKKRRRGIFFLSLLAGLGLLGWLGYSLFTNQSNAPIAKQESLPANKIVSSSADNNNSTVSTGVNTPPAATTNEQLQSEKDNTPIKPNETVIKQKDEKELIVKDKALVPVLPEKKQKTTTEKISTQKITEENINSRTKKDKSETITATSGNNNVIERMNPPVQKDKVQKNIKDTVGKNETVKSIDQKDIAANKEEKENIPPVAKEDTTAKADSAAIAIAPATEEEQAVNEQKKKSPKKIKWGIEISGGVSSHRDNAFLFSQEKSATPRLNNSPGNGAGTGGTVFPVASTQVGSGAAFKLGIIAEMKLSKRSSLFSGLRYSFMSEKIKVGNYIATAFLSQYSSSPVNNAYVGAPRKAYHNKYHFIEIPLMYQLQLNKGTKTSLLWNAGISAGYLFSNNGLVYDSLSGGIYYKDKKAFNKIHFNSGTGFSARFGEKKKIQWAVGPDFSMDMTRLFKQEIYSGKRYLLYGGITGRVFLPSKKK